jgi:hypothetical protein
MLIYIYIYIHIYIVKYVYVHIYIYRIFDGKSNEIHDDMGENTWKYTYVYTSIDVHRILHVYNHMRFLCRISGSKPKKINEEISENTWKNSKSENSHEDGQVVGGVVYISSLQGIKCTYIYA